MRGVLCYHNTMGKDAYYDILGVEQNDDEPVSIGQINYFFFL